MATKFTINGRPYSVKLTDLDADTTLNDFIRNRAGLSGTKFMCHEGGCGVCTCVVTGKHPATGELKTWAVNSCLTLLNSCTDWEITTIEGLGNKRDGYHPIQDRLSKMNGTQCGYCSPGFVMSMYGLLASKEGKVSMKDVENSFGGNICRCTGYRPILDAMKSFAVDSNIEVPAECRDIEDLNLKTCPKTGDRCNGSCNGVAKPTTLTYDDGSQWYWPKSLANLYSILSQLPNDDYALVAGNTAHGIYRRSFNIKTLIDINAIPELKQHKLSEDSLILGGNLSLTETMEIFSKAAKTPGFEYCQQLWNHFDLIANVPVRNMGTLAGNFTIKHQHKEFPSDIFVTFKALNVQIVIGESATTQKIVSLADYLQMPMKKKIIHSFVLKPYPRNKYIFECYKIMPRAQNAHAYVNAAFLVNVEKPSNKVVSANICFGGINPNFIHADVVEKRLIGQSLFDPQLIAKLLPELEQNLIADVVLPDPSPEYRKKLACGLLYKFLLKHAASLSAVPAKLASGGEVLKRPLSSGKQQYEKIDRNAPVYKPIEKYEGLAQTSGEAIYSNDIPVQPNQLYAAFVTAKKVGATVTNMDASAALNFPGVVAFLSAKDIPGKNTFTGVDSFFFVEAEPLFATGPIKYNRQPVGILLADSHATAHKAATLVKLTYEGGSNGNILPTLKDVLDNAASSNRIDHNMKSLIKELKIKDEYDVKGSGNLDMGLQYHYFMEPHTTVAIPFDGFLEVYSATQWMDLTQIVIANVLNLKINEVQIKVRRLGGGYGGKGSRNNMVACAAALAAYKLNRPVRFVQSIDSMMTTMGKRWPLYSDYEFYVKNNGKIVALNSKFYQDAGCYRNESVMGHSMLLAKNCYEFSDNFKLDGYMVTTDSPSNTSCRAPGSVEGIAMIENIVEQIAFETGLDPLDVRTANLISGHKMEEMLPYFVESTQYRQRKPAIAQFNKENRWRKKGLGLAIMEYHIGYFGQYPATLAIYHADGTVIVSHGGIEMGQGMNTKIAQLVANGLDISQDMIKFENSNTMNGANSMVTGGSIGSESLCLALRKCCNTINERLKPVRESLKNASWQEVVQEAYNRKINLIVSDDCKHNEMDPYTVCALCLTEIEVDMITGNYLVNRVDILEDVGESLNPNVDIGQIEGAFIMGLGYWTSEQIVVDSATGEVKSKSTWTYKPPGAKDIPIDFRIEMLPRSPNAAGFMRSKATGEPAICLAIAVAFAMQEALQSARADAGLKKSWVTLCAPMTPEYVLLNAGTDVKMMQLK